MKIFIFGGPGSGKTTISKKLSEEFKIPYFELDKLLYKKDKNTSKKREESERLKIIENFIHKPDWITEGVYRQDWINTILLKADIVFVLVVPKNIRNINTTKRTIKRMFGIEKSFHPSNLKILMDFYKFNDEFERERYIEFDNRLKKLKITPVIVRNYGEIESYIDNDSK